MTLDTAQEYVGTNPLSGLAQLSLLFGEGLDRDDRVLEIGCGTLNLGRVLIPWLHPRRYFGIDPNSWLRQSAITDDKVLRGALADREARFMSRGDFRWPGGRGTFNAIFAHSILTHTSVVQMQDFMRAVREQLHVGGFALVSLNIGEETTATDEWTYPEGVNFSERDVRLAAADAGLTVERKWDHQRHMMLLRPEECHDWIVLR